MALVGYEGQATMDVVKGSRCRRNCPPIMYTFQMNTKLYDEVTGSLDLQGRCDEDECTSFADIDFDVC